MNIVKELDLAIKLAEKNTTAGAYRVGDTEYDAYLSQAEWAELEKSMKENPLQPKAYAEYSAGGGDEMTEKNGRPPKMASYGSSSRMIYQLSRHKEGFHYEKKLPTTVGGTANLDGFYEDDSRYIFVEAKCHEPYSKKRCSVSRSYEELYQFINNRMAGSLSIGMETSKCGRYLNVEYFSDGEKLEHFDLKQMICHLLGIATGLLDGTLKQKQIDFIYLLYDPTELALDAGAKATIDEIYERTCEECNAIDFATLFHTILIYLNHKTRNDSLPDDIIETVIEKFTFALASQEFYSILLQ